MAEDFKLSASRVQATVPKLKRFFQVKMLPTFPLFLYGYAYVVRLARVSSNSQNIFRLRAPLFTIASFR